MPQSCRIRGWGNRGGHDWRLPLTRSRQRLAVPFALLAAITLLLTEIVPVLAAPGGSGGLAPAPAEHVECNVTFDDEGNVLLGAQPLTDAQVAVLELLFTDTDAAATLELAAQADAEACLNLVIDTEIPVSATLTGHVDICGMVSWNGQGLVINDVFFEADLNNELGAFLDAAGGLELCASITVEDNAVSIDLSLETCASVTLTAEDTVVFANGIDFELPVDSVTGAAELELGVEVFLAVLFSGSIDLESDAVTLEAELLGTEGCEAVEPGSLTIVKETDPAGSTATFAFEAAIATGGGIGNGAFDLRDGESFSFDALATYTIAEVLTDSQVTAGWTLSAVTCDAAGATITDDVVEVVIAAGDDVTCTFENELAATGGGGGGGGTMPPSLPDTMVSETGTPPASLTPILALVMLVSLGTLGYVNLVRRHRR